MILAMIATLTAINSLPNGTFFQMLAAWLVAITAFCLVAWIPFAPTLWQSDTQRIRFQGRFACGALTRFSYDSQGHLRYVALTAELHEEPWGERIGNAESDGPPIQLLAAVQYMEYAETKEGTRTVAGYSVGGGGAFEPTAAEIRLPLDLFETTLQDRASAACESYLGSGQITVQLRAAGPLHYGPCQMIWHSPLSIWQFDSTGSRQSICAIDAEIDGKTLPILEQNSVSGMLLTGAGWFEKQHCGAG